MRKLRVLALTLILALLNGFVYSESASAAPIGTGLSLYYKSDSAAWTVPPTAFTTSTCHISIGNINFNWGGGAPGGSCGGDNFTGYGVGYILAPVTGNVNFCEQTDDQFYMRIDSSFIINDTSAKAAATGQSCNGTGTMSMVAGTSYPIEIWMHEQGGGAEWRLLWSYAGQSSYVIVPVDNLNPTTLTVADTTPPTISTAVLNSSGTSIVLTYNETLSATTAATSAFAVSDSGTAVSVSSVTASGFTVTLALASTINIGRVVTLSYTDPTGSDDANAIQDSAGNDAISLSARSVTNNSTVKATPTFSSWANVTKTFGDANYTVTAPTVTGSLAGSFSYSSSNTGVISISSSTFTVVGGGSATITATFTPTDTTNYNSATTTNTVTVNKASQSAITITPAAATYGTNLTLTSTGGSTGGSYSYTKVSGNCTLAGAVLTPTATGSCVVQSSLAANANYLAETSTATTITISSGTVSASLTLAPGNLIFREAKAITAVATVAGKVTFRVAGKILPGCKNKTVSAGNSSTTTCSYRPSVRSYVMVSATLDPTNISYVGTVTYSAQYLVTKRVGAR